MKELHDFRREIAKLTTFETLTEYFQNILSPRGFYAYTLGRALLKRGMVDSTTATMFSTLGQEVHAEYEEKEFATVDPVFDLMASRFLPFTKSSIEPQFESTPNHQEIVEMADNHDLGDAFMIPLATSEASRGVVLFTHQSPEEFAATLGQHGPFLHLASLYFYARAEELGFGAPPSKDAELSEREIECLQYVAQGKTNDETSDALGISERTVRFHITNACEKLGTDRRSKAVTIAIQKGLIRT